MKNKFSLRRLLTLLFFGSLMLGQFQRFQLTSDIAFYLHDVLLFILILTTLPLFTKYFHQFKKHKTIQLISLFSLALILSLTINFKSIFASITPLLHLLRYILYSLSLPTFYILRKDNIIKHSLLVVLAILGGGLMFSGIVQYLLFPDMREFMLLGWDNHYYRSVSSLLDPNFFGLMMILFWLIIKQLSFRHVKKVEILALITLFFTYSRSAYVAFIAAAVIIAFQKKSKKIIMTAILSLVIAFLLLPRPGGEGVKLLRTASIFTRIKSQSIAVGIFKKNPIVGVGFNAYSMHAPTQNDYDFVPSHPSSPDNSFLLILATSGVIGFATFMLLGNHLISSYKNHAVILPSIAAISMHSLFNNSIFYPWVIIWLMVLWSEELNLKKD